MPAPIDPDTRNQIVLLANQCFNCFHAEQTTTPDRLSLISELGEDITEQMLRFVQALRGLPG